MRPFFLHRPRISSRNPCPNRRRFTPLLCGWFAAASLTSSHVQAQSPREAASPETSLDEDLNAAQAAYREGDWAKTEALLTPHLEALRLQFPDGTALDAALIYLDTAYRLESAELPTMAPPEARDELLRALVENAPFSRLTPAMYGESTYEAFARMQRTLEDEAAKLCKFEVAACNADAASLQAEFARLREDHEQLSTEFEQQEVEVRDFGVRTRAFALLPFGLGHFYNNRPKLGASFLATEVAFGATALGLLLTRVVKYNCARTAGFKSSSLDCDIQDTPSNRRQILAVRQSEEVFAWLFLGAVVSDIITSQILFKPYGELRRRTVPRKELEDGDAPAGATSSRGTFKLRPQSSVSRRGLTIGLTLDF